MPSHHAYRLVVTLSALLLLPVACGAPRVATVPRATSTPTGIEATVTTASATATPEPAATATTTPTPGRTSTPRTDQQAQNMTLVGALALESKDKSPFGDIAAYKDLALIGISRFGCGQGVPIIDISNPAKARLLAQSPSLENVAMEDLDAIQIGDRDVLAIGLQVCNPGLG